MMLDESIPRYIKDMEATFGKDAGEILILKIIACCMPVLHFLGAGLYKPIAIILESEKACKKFADDFCCFSESKIHSLGASAKIIEAGLKRPGEDVLFFHFAKSSMTEENLQRVCQFCRDNADTAVFVLFVNLIPENIGRYFSGGLHISTFISDTRKEDRDAFLRNLIEYLIENVHEINKIGKLEGVEGIIAEFPELATIEIAYKIAEKILYEAYVEGELVDSFPETACNLIKKWPEITADEEIETWFLSEIWKRADNMKGAYDITFPVERSVIDDVHAMLYNADDYFVSEPFFAGICKPLESLLSSRSIKERLFRLGIISGEGRSRIYWTKKIYIRLSDGTTERVRRICLDRKKIDEGYTFSLAEKIKIATRKEATGGEIC